MRLNRYLAIGGGAVVALLLAACSSASSTPTSTPPSNSSSSPGATSSGGPTAPAAATGSCSVITAAEASAALGQPVTGPRLGNATVEGGKACVYYGPNAVASIGPNTPQGDTVRVVLVTGPNAKKFFDDYRTKAPAPKTISGLGDQAFYDGFASLSVLKGAAYVRIYAGVTFQHQLAAEEALARDALPRM